ncbi:hypothetical protein DFH07DRAFT_958125 [Mycena maculata]|uniref:Uncharacterized protein n=1 Tax=Mycena maculata TaxID=230809 RepID=A0AAD7J979_9AGAR|nr:hypothetical protein DFH07DRAFT_958125 [Mycena maculata]
MVASSKDDAPVILLIAAIIMSCCTSLSSTTDSFRLVFGAVATVWLDHVFSAMALPRGCPDDHGHASDTCDTPPSGCRTYKSKTLLPPPVRLPEYLQNHTSCGPLMPYRYTRSSTSAPRWPPSIVLHPRCSYTSLRSATFLPTSNPLRTTTLPKPQTLAQALIAPIPHNPCPPVPIEAHPLIPRIQITPPKSQHPISTPAAYATVSAYIIAAQPAPTSTSIIVLACPSSVTEALLAGISVHTDAATWYGELERMVQMRPSFGFALMEVD